MSIPSVPAVSGLEEIAGRYDALLCDVWGVLHNGRESFRDASDALVAFRAGGGVVVLLTNAPRPNPAIRAQVLRLGVAAEAFDAIVTSGDVTLSLVAERIAEKVFHLGPERDHALFEAAAKMAGAAPKLVSLDEADYALCTGLFDDTKETPADYESTLQEIRGRKMPFICANPDLIVHRGDKVAYCAGALAKRLGEIGGDPIYCGKPHAPIYRVALRAAEFAREKPIERRRVLAVGDGMRTDIAGAAAQGFDTLFVTAGIHVADVHSDYDETAALAWLFQREKLWPSATVKTLRR
jgi:HAD superfamily hydrolase (TIGR01459 family)